jgi:hypothetical protein
MIIKVGTFSLNNLFSRFNFAGAIDAIHESAGRRRSRSSARGAWTPRVLR